MPVNTIPDFNTAFAVKPKQRVDAQGVSTDTSSIPADQWSGGSADQAAQTSTNTNTQGASSDRVFDALNMGPAIQSNVSAAQGVDATRNANLSPLASGTDPRYATNVNSAVSNALTGPQNNASGNMARIRTAATAASNAQAQNVANQLAANQGMGTTATNAAVGQASPYLGRDTTSNVLEDAQGLARAFNDRYAIGKGPTSQSSSGKVICTAYKDLGWLPNRIWAADISYYKKQSTFVQIGYRSWAQPLARLISRRGLIAYLCWPIARGWAYQMAYLEGVWPKASIIGRITLFTLKPICSLIGRLASYPRLARINS